MKLKWITLIALVGSLWGCSDAQPTPEPESLVIGDVPVPQRVEFSLPDGTPLVGWYYQPASAPALTPTLILVHMRGANKETWKPLVDVLQSGGISIYATLAIDLPGHGESGGQWSEQGTLDAVAAAVGKLSDLDGADPSRVVIIGASIGADAAVEACPLVHCLGAVSLSPGGFLGIPYADSLAAIRDSDDQPVLCLASENDGASPQACRDGEFMGLSEYETQIYPGGAHGTNLFSESGLNPSAISRIVQWLNQHLPPE